MKERKDEVDKILWKLSDHPLRHLHVPRRKRKVTDPPIEASSEDEAIDFDSVYADPGPVILDDMGKVEW